MPLPFWSPTVKPAAAPAPIARRIMESVELMNRGKLTVDLSPLAVAKGNFKFVESVEYKELLPPE